MTKFSLFILLLLSVNIATSQVQSGFEALTPVDLPHAASFVNLSVFDTKVIIDLDGGGSELYAFDFATQEFTVFTENKNDLTNGNYTRVLNRFALTLSMYGSVEVYDLNEDGTATFVKDFGFIDTIYRIGEIDNDRFIYTCCTFSAYNYSRSNDTNLFLGDGTEFPYGNNYNFGFQGNIVTLSSSEIGLYDSNNGTLINEYNNGTTIYWMAETLDNEWVYTVDRSSDNSIVRHYLMNPANLNTQTIEIQTNNDIITTSGGFSYILDGVKHYAYLSSDKIYINKETSALSTNYFEKEALNIYPNPANDIIHLKTEKEISNIKIYNILGKEILKSTSKTINVSELSNGLYLLKAEDLNGNILKTKFVKE